MTFESRPRRSPDFTEIIKAVTKAAIAEFPFKIDDVVEDDKNHGMILNGQEVVCPSHEFRVGRIEVVLLNPDPDNLATMASANVRCANPKCGRTGTLFQNNELRLDPIAQ